MAKILVARIDAKPWPLNYLPYWRLLIYALVLFSGFYLSRSIKHDPLTPFLWVYGFGVFLYALYLLILRSKVYSPSRLLISHERIVYEPSKILGLRIGRAWSVESASIRELKLIHRKTLVPSIVAELQRFPRRTLNLVAWIEEGKEDWFPNSLPEGGILSIIMTCPAYQALVILGYKVVLP